ncbi:hypothetical protein [Arcobacter ellisii]|uniref:Lipoprotein n=1 Tax=Arcobacter ellisii TaxID=913109 RepID=A0A347U555_9BACT|nr:hypothetical protein [Arcobacter ellisii]AXX93983.1 hypothetical protein AELL_0288 [Arcobacter ellisii]RXI28336.1 hypothetical protein CP962_13890 [Arcobacter ellisii]
MKKMYTKSILGVALLSATALLTGCGSNNIPMEPVNAKTLELNKLKEQYPDVNITQQDIDKGNILYSGASGDYSMMSMKKQNNHIISGIQKASMDTLKSKAKYFEVVAPKTLADKKLSTYEEFSKECLSSNPFGGSDPCDITNSSFFLRTSGIVGHLNDNNATAKLLIKIYTEKPSNVAVFDANEVLDSLKKKDELQKNLTENK